MKNSEWEIRQGPLYCPIWNLSDCFFLCQSRLHKTSSVQAWCCCSCIDSQRFTTPLAHSSIVQQLSTIAEAIGYVIQLH